MEGLQRVDAGTVFASIPVKVGDTYNDERGAAAIRALFALGLFQDVRIEARGNDMVVVVQERPTINLVDVSVSGRTIEKAALLKGLANMGIASGRPYDKSTQDRAVQEILKQYQDRGFYAAEIIPTVTPDERNRVNVHFDVREGSSARIKDIRFVGNQAFSTSTLRGEMNMDTGGWMSWYTKSNQYAENKLNADLDAIRNFYFNRGYLEFRIDSAQVGMSPDKREISLTIHVTEGPRYVVSAVSLGGNYLDKDDEFKSLIKIRAGEAYKQEDVASSITAMKEHFGNYGYAFAKIEAKSKIDRAKQQIELILHADPAQRAYIRRINVSGNTKTRDEVIRRELRQYESAWYNADKIKLSKERLDRLGYFTDINVETQPVNDVPDQADLEVIVKERPTGSIQLGAGYSTSDKLSFSLGLSQDNIFGSGQSLALNINTSAYNRNYSITSTDPYFTTSGISRTFSASHSLTKPRPVQGGDYTIRSDNAGVSFGVPFSEIDRVYFSLGFERYSILPGSTEMPPLYQNYVDYYGKAAYGIPLSIGWGRDSRDSALAPTSGSFQRISGVVSPAGGLRYAIATYKYQHYFPLSKNFTLMFNTDLGYGKGFNCRKNSSDVTENCYPFYKNFYMGGIGSVRGFDQGAIGPQQYDPTTGTTYSIGGTRMFNTNLELIAPFPGANNDKTLRMFAFLDAGNVYMDKSPTYTPVSADKMVRASAGVGLRWVSPMGPLSLSFGIPFRKQSTDRLQKFQFQMGTTF